MLLPIDQWNGNQEKKRQKSSQGNCTSSLLNLCSGSDVRRGRKEALRGQGKSRNLGFDRRTIISTVGRIRRERHEHSVSIQRLTRAPGLG